MVKKKHVPTLFMKYKSKKRELVEFPIIDQHTMLNTTKNFRRRIIFHYVFIVILHCYVIDIKIERSSATLVNYIFIIDQIICYVCDDDYSDRFWPWRQL